MNQLVSFATWMLATTFAVVFTLPMLKYITGRYHIPGITDLVAAA